MTGDKQPRRLQAALVISAVAVLFAALATAYALTERSVDEVVIAGDGPTSDQREQAQQPEQSTTSAPAASTTTSPANTVDQTAPTNTGALTATLASEPDTATKGTVVAELRVGTEWLIVVVTTGADPGRSYGVMVGPPVGEMEQPTVCSFVPDTTGTGRCEGTMDALRAGPLTTVSVLGADSPSLSYRLVASGSFS